MISSFRGMWAAVAFAALLLLACKEELPKGDPALAKIQAAIKLRAAIDTGYLADARIALLLATCQKGGYFDRDTGDPLALLLDKLQNGSTDSLHRAKEELAGMGELAAMEVGRLLNRNLEAPMGGANLQNAIEVLGLMDTPAAHDPLIRSLNHPRDSVRGAALRALAGGAAQPQDFERLLSHVEVEAKQLREQATIALASADVDRSVALFLTWLEAGTNSDLWGFFIDRIFEVDPEPLRAKALQLFDKVTLDIGLPLAALALDTGDARPRAMLNKYIHSDESGLRMPAINALIKCGRLSEVQALGLTDPNPIIRQIILTAEAEAVGTKEAPSKSTLDRFHAALNDNDKGVRKVSLKRLLAWGDASAQDRALSLLAGSRDELQDVALVIADALKMQPDFAKRVLSKLLAIEADNQTRPLPKRLAILQAIGQVPLADAASYLLGLGKGAEGRLQGLPVFRGLMVQASNTGPLGRKYLASKLEQETDPIKRIDMIWAISAQRDDFGREFLLDFLRADHDPFELLFAAERLAKGVSLAIAAPVLKRLTLRVQHAQVRRALECLMWRWY